MLTFMPLLPLANNNNVVGAYAMMRDICVAYEEAHEAIHI